MMEATQQMKLNPIGLTFVVHHHPAHLIRAFRSPGHPDEATLCGAGSPMGSTTISGFIDGGEFDSAGNPMPVCDRCKARLKTN